MRKDSISLRQLRDVLSDSFVQVTDNTTGYKEYYGFLSDVKEENDILDNRIIEVRPAAIEAIDGGLPITIIGLEISIFIDRTI